MTRRRVGQQMRHVLRNLLFGAASLAVLPMPACVRTVVVHRKHPAVQADIAVQDSPPPDTGTLDTENARKPETSPDALTLSPLQATGKFTNQTAALGAAFALDPGKKGAPREPWASLGMLIDLDHDGLLDFVATDGMAEVRWGRAVQPWKWITAPLADVKGEGVRCLAATDSDGDGYPEIIVGGSRFCYNEPATTEIYTEEGEARGLGLGKMSGVQSVTPVDLDADGLLDLAVGEFTCDGKSRLRAFVNQGNGRYAERAEQMGLDDVASIWAVLATDFDGDRRPDLMAVKEGCPPAGGNAYFHSTANGFERKDLAPLFFAPKQDGGTPMGGSVGDVDRDGRLDFLFSEIGYRQASLNGMDMRHPDLAQLASDPASGNHLLLQTQAGVLVSQGLAAGLALPLNTAHRPMVSWTTRLLDFDADGHLDAILSHGQDYDAFILADEAGMRPVLMRNRGDATFVDVSQAFGFPDMHLNRALATADVDDDGDLDLFFGGQLMQPLLLRNEVKHPNRMLTVRLKGRVSNLWGLQSRVLLQTSKRTYVAEMTTHAPFATMDQPLVHFGVPADETWQTLTVRWPSGYDQVVQVPVNVAKLPLVVEEPPLVSLSHRFVYSIGSSAVTVQARAFATDATPLPSAVVTIELAPGSPGTWSGLTQCPGGECTRMWKPPEGQAGEAVFVVTHGGQELVVRPKVRFAAP